MRTILIVDDSIMLLEYLAGHFEKYSGEFEYITATDGQEAIDILEKKHISLLVTDLEMPRVDGLDLLAYTHKYHSTIPCIVMSAHGTPKIKEKLGADILEFIEKPFTGEALVKAIISALNRSLPGGTLVGISIANFLQMIEMEQKTCLFEVISADNPKGFFYFKGGILHHAVYGDLKGEEAAVKMIQIENATVNFKKPPTRKIPKRIETGLMALILKAMENKKGSSN